jgi:hypothetical protein
MPSERDERGTSWHMLFGPVMFTRWQTDCHLLVREDTLELLFFNNSNLYVLTDIETVLDMLKRK